MRLGLGVGLSLGICLGLGVGLSLGSILGLGLGLGEIDEKNAKKCCANFFFLD